MYPGIKIYQPVVNGLGGNLVAIFASRLSTQLHLDCDMGRWCDWAPEKFYLYPKETFFAFKSSSKFSIQTSKAKFFTQFRLFKDPESTVARVLIILALPAHLAFFFIIYFIDISLIDSSVKYLDVSLVAFYMIVALIQVISLFSSNLI